MKKEKIILIWNRIVNTLLATRATILVKLSMYPKHKDIRRVRKNKYAHTQSILANEFVGMEYHENGSARPDMDSAFISKMVKFNKDEIIIKTKLRKTIGREWGYHDENNKWHDGDFIIKDSGSGLAKSIGTFRPDGVYSATLTFDNSAIGSWDAWWFFRLTPKQEKNKMGAYREVDMMERFYGHEDIPNAITSSIHYGVNANDKKMYNNTYWIPKSINKIRVTIKFIPKRKNVKVYINGLLVFVGYQWWPKEPLQMIINSGIQHKELKHIKHILEKRDYVFKVSNIKHYTS